MTKEDWKSLTKKQQWDVIVSLRGPDIRRSEVIKSFTTGVIRYGMSNLMRVGGQLSTLGFVVIPNDSVFKKPEKADSGSIWPDLNHFAQHTYEAAEIIGIPIISVPGPIWEKMVLASNDHNAKVLFLEYMKDNPGIVSKAIYKKHIEGLLDSYNSYLGGGSNEG